MNNSNLKLRRFIPLLVLALLLLTAYGVIANSDILTEDLTGDLTATDLVHVLLGPDSGAIISNVTFTGDLRAAGTFSGGTEIVGFDSGIILGSGSVAGVVGPNTSDAYTDPAGGFGTAGDVDLDSLIPGYSTNDAAVLEFDFDCQGIPIFSFEYVFSSEEYNEWVNSPFNDVFGWFLDGVNIALLPDGVTPVSINNVNGGNPLGVNESNPVYYINNDLSDGGGSINIQADGMTIVLPALSDLDPGTHHIRLAIADAGDYILDSWVLLKGGSFQCAPPAGFVTGGGWIDSPEGAYKADPSLTGKANFGFVSKYKKGATVPTGQTQFLFQVADLNFHSNSYQWLVVTRGGTRAQFKGSGTINGMGDYKFMLWASDDEPDTFRIKIWEEDEYNAETVIYDNGFNQEIGGGSITIHTK